MSPVKNIKKLRPNKVGGKKRLEFKIKITIWKILIAAFLFIFFLPLIFTIFQFPGVENKVETSRALSDIKGGKVKEILVENEKLLLTYQDGSIKVATKEEQESFADLLEKAEIDPTSINYTVVDQTLIKVIGEILGVLLPIILMAVFFFFIIRAQSRGAQDIFSFGRSRAKLFAKGKQSITFNEVAGVEDAKKELEEVVDFLKNPAKYRRMGARTPKGAILLGPAGVGKCVTGDTLVWTGKGVMEIQHIPKYFAVEESGYVHGATLASFDPNSPSVTTIAKASCWYDLGMSDTLKLKTRMGHEIEGTLEHPLVVVDKKGRLKFRRLDKIKKGDWIPLKTNDQLFGNYKCLDTKTSYLLGLLTGDGGMTIKDRIYFSTADKQLLLSFKRFFEEEFGYKVKPTSNKYDVVVCSSSIKSELIQYGLSEAYSRNKKVPDYILMAPKENVVAFLQGLFDTDGSVFKSGKVELSSSSEKLARRVSSLLLNLGVMHKFQIKGNNQYADSYRILISGTGLLAFAQQVGFRLKRKQERLNSYLGRIKTRTNIDLVPHQGLRIRRVWRHLVETGKKPSLYVSVSFHKQICRYAKNERKPAMETLRLFLDACEKADPEICSNEDFRYMRFITNCGLFFDQVDSIEEFESRVYDFTVPQTHSFIANGFVSHNTLLARAVAGEAGVPFFSMAGSEFMEMLVGVGASVTGDTPILIRQSGKTKLLEIGEFVDRYYGKNKKEGFIKIKGVETLGLKPEINGFWGSHSKARPVFGGSKWQPAEAVYRHKVDEIYEISFLGGRLRTTGDHSVFVREQGGIRHKEVRELKPGDVLVNLPMNTRAWDSKQKKTVHRIKKHEFSKKVPEIYLDVWQDDAKEIAKYEFVIANQGTMSQYAVADEVGVTQGTVGNWQRGIHIPTAISKKSVKLNLPDRVKVTTELMELFGYYTAEGRGTNSLEFTFGVKEEDNTEKVVKLMKEVFGLADPRLIFTDTNTVRIIYYSAHLGRFFAKHCGNGSHNKHVPPFIWDLPKKYFLAYLRSYSNGDGYITKLGKLSASSVSQSLIRELAWLCSMHGIKVGIKHEIRKAGRSILNGKSLPETESWTIIIGKTSNPFVEKAEYPYQFKGAIVRSVKKRSFDGYVYDLCGVENEAFFGGETPVLLHNSRVRDLFSQAKTSAPSIIFIDEIDAIGRQRGRGFIGGHDEREQTLNQILVEMDGFTPNDKVVILAATNRGDLLDPALLRPGRFDRRVVLDMPDKEGRIGILKIHARGKRFVEGIDWETVAERTVGFSGADLENMLNEAAIAAARENKKEIEASNIEEAATKVKLGPAKKKLQSEEDKKITAYHEAGHAITTHNLPKMDPVHRISIVARGMSLGHTLIPPAADRSHETKTRILQQITAMLGGRAAEEIVFNEMTSGAGNDIEQSTRLARAMVVDFGMSSLGPVNLGPQIEYDDLGKPAWMEPTQISPAMQEKVDGEVKGIIDSCYKEAIFIIKKERKILDKLVERLLKKETLTRDDFEKIVGKKSSGKTA